MKPRHIIKAQRARLMFDLAVRRLSGEITSEQHRTMCKRVERAFVNVWFCYAKYCLTIKHFQDE